jgi:hypothetical protein
MLRAYGLLWLLPIVWAADPAPFWKAKEKVYQRIKDGEVIVVVTSSPGIKTKHQLRINGAGHVNAPRDFVFERSQHYEDLPKVSSYIRGAKFNPETRILNIVISAFGHSADMDIRIDPKATADPRQIAFELVRGPMQGLNGVFNYAELPKAKTEVGIEGQFHYDTFPIAKLFLEFGMEVVFQRMATGLRSHVESEYAKVQREKK